MKSLLVALSLLTSVNSFADSVPTTACMTIDRWYCNNMRLEKNGRGILLTEARAAEKRGEICYCASPYGDQMGLINPTSAELDLAEKVMKQVQKNERNECKGDFRQERE